MSRWAWLGAMLISGGCLSNPTPHPAVDAFAGNDAFEDPASGNETATDGVTDASVGCVDAGDAMCDVGGADAGEVTADGVAGADGVDGDAGPGE
jgi:hypothetical protein